MMVYLCIVVTMRKMINSIKQITSEPIAKKLEMMCINSFPTVHFHAALRHMKAHWRALCSVDLFD